LKKHGPEKVVNLKILLCMSEMISGLKIYYLKSEFISMGGDNDVMAFYADMFKCQVGKIPMKYLDVPVMFSNLNILIGTSWMVNALNTFILGSMSLPPLGLD
jgi:hypothetical protein